MSAERCILDALPEVMTLMRRAFEAVGDAPPADHALAQVNLRNGDALIREYLAVGDPWVAFDHLLYMIEEPPLPISPAVFALVENAGIALGLDPDRWRGLAS
jgi:hypothetical protein